MKRHLHRRNFLKTSSALLGIAFTGTAFDFKMDKPLLSFSTLGCPDWSFAQIVNFASANKYDGIEIRGIKRELDLPKCPEFNSQQNILASRKMMEDKGLKFSDLGSSAQMHHLDKTERQKNLDEAKRFIDLAQQLNCPYVRVFPNDFQKGQDKNVTIDIIVKSLLELGDYSKRANVTVVMETHGEVVQTEDLEKIMKGAAHPHVGLVWDIVNMWSVTKEPPQQVYEGLKKYIRHTHIKDMAVVNGKEKYTLLGRGETPIFEAIDILYKNNYKGYFSFEWEKMWHPEIEEPEIALADFPKAMNEHFKA
jgi:sugar phosphate isomerase/epimerase